MNYANCSNSPYSISNVVYTSGNINISGGNFLRHSVTVTEAIHNFFPIFLFLSLTGKHINDHDDADDMI